MKEKVLTKEYRPMLHLAERKLLTQVFQERIEKELVNKDAMCQISLMLLRRFSFYRNTKAEAVFEMVFGRCEGEKKLPRRLKRRYRIKLFGGQLILLVQVYSKKQLEDIQKVLARILVADMAEVLKLIANGDCYVRLGAEKVIAKIASETGVADPTAWTRKYLAPPPSKEDIMTIPQEVRQYYRLYNKCLSHAQPQHLLRRTWKGLIDTRV